MLMGDPSNNTVTTGHSGPRKETFYALCNAPVVAVSHCIEAVENEPKDGGEVGNTQMQAGSE